MNISEQMMNNKICAIIPAAGKGARLGFGVPKILVEFKNNVKVIDLLLKALLGSVDKIVIVVSPETLPLLQNDIDNKIQNNTIPDKLIEIVIQETPKGMGDAIFCGYHIWKNYDNIFIVWGDQASISKDTVQKTINLQLRFTSPCFTIPVVYKEDLYVEYVFDADGSLKTILQKREGDAVNESGYSDVAIFSLSTLSIFELWNKYRNISHNGVLTNEINFLPFLVYLSQNNWKTNIVHVKNPVEAVGLNTYEDYQLLLKALAF